MNFTIEHEREDDGRWLAEVPELSGVLAYGATAKEAMAKAEALALRVLAERLDNNEIEGLSRALSKRRSKPSRPMIDAPEHALSSYTSTTLRFSLAA